LPPPPTPPPPTKPEEKPPELAKIKPPEPPKPEPPKPEPPKVKPIEKKPQAPTLALIPKPQPPPPPKQETPPPPPQPKKEVPNFQAKSVEVDDDKNAVNEPPPEATYLSDKNRRVQVETRDTRTNLERIEKGKASASEKSDDKESEEVGGA